MFAFLGKRVPGYTGRNGKGRANPVSPANPESRGDVADSSGVFLSVERVLEQDVSELSYEQIEECVVFLRREIDRIVAVNAVNGDGENGQMAV